MMGGEQWRVYKDGEPVSEMLSSVNDCFAYTLKHHGQSVDYALKYGGFSWRNETTDEVLRGPNYGLPIT
jgi:hypothetical protein